VPGRSAPVTLGRGHDLPDVSRPDAGAARFGCRVCFKGATHRTVLERMCILDEVRERQTT
jgi:hypothetical protein